MRQALNSNPMLDPLLLARRVVNFSKEILALVVFSVLLKPQSQDEPVTKEQDEQQARVVHTEPFTGSFRGNGGCGGHQSRDSSRQSGHEACARNLGCFVGHQSSGALGNAEC